MNVAKGPKEIPGFAVYIFPSASEEPQEGTIPVGQALLNLDATLWCCVDNPEIHWKEIIADSIGHEFLHALQDLFGQALEEYGIEESIEAARDSGNPGFEPYIPGWQELLDNAMTTASPGSIVLMIDEDHPEATLHLIKQEPMTPEALKDLHETEFPEWYAVEGTVDINYVVNEQGETVMDTHRAPKKKDNDTDGE